MHLLSTLKRSTRFSSTVLFRLVLSALAIALAVSSVPATAQSTYGAIIGTVKDASGALVSGAKVTLVNTGTSFQRQATTNSAGDIRFSTSTLDSIKSR